MTPSFIAHIRLEQACLQEQCEGGLGLQALLASLQAQLQQGCILKCDEVRLQARVRQVERRMQYLATGQITRDHQARLQPFILHAVQAQHVYDAAGARNAAATALSVQVVEGGEGEPPPPPRITRVDVCPVCPHNPVLVMDSVEPVLLCPTPSCTFGRPFESRTCKGMSNDDRVHHTRSGVNVSAEIHSTMQMVSAEVYKPIPREVIVDTMEALATMGVPAHPMAVTHDVVSEALRRAHWSKYYNNRAQIRALLLGVRPPRFSPQEKAIVCALHGICVAMQPWVDPAKRTQNAQFRLMSMCHRMGWWHHLPAPRFMTGPENFKKYDTCNRIMTAALGWRFHTCERVLKARTCAVEFQARVEANLLGLTPLPALLLPSHIQDPKSKKKAGAPKPETRKRQRA
jgi:hypothetical protein